MEKDIIYDLVFAYVNQDLDFPHDFEVKAIENALTYLKNNNADKNYIKFTETVLKTQKDNRGY